MKFEVVPDASERCTTAILVEGSLAEALSAAIFGSSQVVMSPWKIPAITSGVKANDFTPATLNDTVMGAPAIGK